MSFSSWVAKWISQMAHVGWGAFLTMAVLARHTPRFYAFFAVVVFAAIKEFIFDPLTETPLLSGGLKGDALDFLFWCVGATLGILAAL